MADTLIRPARTSDVRAIRGFIDAYSPDGRLLSKATVTLFEDIQEFLVAERDGEVVDWTEHAVGWDQTYGVDVMGNHHARVMRFMQDKDVSDVVAADVCDNMRRSLEAKGVTLHVDFAGDARAAVRSALQPA